jgi:hypothetical protein
MSRSRITMGTSSPDRTFNPLSDCLTKLIDSVLVHLPGRRSRETKGSPEHGGVRTYTVVHETSTLCLARWHPLHGMVRVSTITIIEENQVEPSFVL